MRPAAKARFSDSIIRIEDQFYILASSSLVDDRTRVLKDDETFAIFDRHGDIQAAPQGEQGIYHEGTRYLSRCVLTFGDERPLLLTSTIKTDNAVMTVDLTNPDREIDQRVVLPRGTIHLFRSKFLWRSVCYEQIRIRNYGLKPVDVFFALEFASDFADIFEVRGAQRPQRGELLKERIDANSLTLQYRGLDDVIRRTSISCSPDAAQIINSTMRFEASLAAQGEATYWIAISCSTEDSAPALFSYHNAAQQAEHAGRQKRTQISSITTSNEQLDLWINRSVVDLRMMITQTPYGLYPYAGVPWFSAAFGRDGIITAMQCLTIHPSLARSVLIYLAETQAQELDQSRDAEPGKILHERRYGEMAALNEVPFGKYYGSVDSTPLFIMLAGMYYERTADVEFIRSIWPNISLALNWIDRYGDRDGDGFVEYHRVSENGLANQGWKDSHDSVFHVDGSLAEGPIALCEVQGYVFAAKRYASQLASLIGENARATSLLQQATDLQQQFQKAFWCEELNTFALALDGRKNPCRVRTSNAGHTLFTRIASDEQARKIARTLLDSQTFSGWGIRTVACNEVRYNPMSYHNGSVWPHDNALIAAGFANYNMKEEASMVLDAIFAASTFVELHRLPELFCGFHRREGDAPTEYPVACAPQSWAAGTVFLLLQAILGLQIDATQSQVFFQHPWLPNIVERLRIHNLRVADSVLDLELISHQNDVVIHILKRSGNVHVITIK